MINTMLAKLSSDGDWQWASTSNTSDYSWAVAIGTTASGDIVLVGGRLVPRPSEPIPSAMANTRSSQQSRTTAA